MVSNIDRVSDTYLRIIPTEPGYVPSVLARERAMGMLRRAMPLADDITAQVTEHVRFVDCGTNFETVRCAHCGADLGEWWSEAMELAQAQHFEDLRITTPCCNTRTDLNQLVYSWPAGFARYTLEALNSGIDSLPGELIKRIEDALRSPIRIIWADY